MATVFIFKVTVCTGKCEDDPNWFDNEHGDGKSTCANITADECQNYAAYSIEARRACPKACNACGIQLFIFD